MFYQFIQPPIFFNTVETNKLKESQYASDYQQLEQRHTSVFESKKEEVAQLIYAMRHKNEQEINQAQERVAGSRLR